MTQAPLDLAAWLRNTYDLNFTPQIIETKEALIAHLRDAGQHPETWGSGNDRTRSLDELWEEHEEDDNVLALLPDGSIGRFIRTVTLYVKLDRNEDGRIVTDVLREYVLWPDGRVEERPYLNSGSEKLKVHEKHPDAAIRRFFSDELGLTVRKSHRRYPYLQKIVGTTVNYFKDAVTGIARKIDIHDSRSFPMVVTYNRLYHFLWNMTLVAKNYYKATYREHHKRKTLEFRWQSANSPMRVPSHPRTHR